MAAPTLQQMRYLVAIADTRHFRRAAELSHVSQPTLSGQLRELENRLGVQLVERSRTKVVLTTMGKEIAARARAILRDVADLTQLARQNQGVLTGVIRLGTLTSLGPYLLPRFLPDLHQSYPDLRLYVREAMPQTLLHDLDEGALDLLIFPLPVNNTEFEVARLFREPLLIAGATDHPLTAKTFIERNDLKGETVLALERGHRLHDQVRELCDLYGAKLTLDYEGTSLDTLRQMVGMGMGLTFLPALYVQSEINRASDVIARPLRSRPPTRTVGLIWRRQSARREEFAALADLVRGIVKGRVPEVMTLT